MSIVRPFRGLHPAPNYASQIASPPYDVLNAREARAMAHGNPYSFLRVNKSELEFDDGVNPYSPEVYERAYQNLQRFRHDSVMVQDNTPSFYIYRLTMNGRPQTGLVALTSVDEYDKGLIKKHEHTRPEKVNDRANHIVSVKAEVGPVFSAFRSNLGIERIFEKIAGTPPYIDFVAADGIRHELWLVSDPGTVKAIVDGFASLDALYIADGHHRSESASEVARRCREKNSRHTGNEGYNFFLNVIFPDHHLAIMPYNRVVRDLNGMSLPDLISKASEKFVVSSQSLPVEPRQPHQFGLYAERQWYLLAAKPGSWDTQHPIHSIDSAILSDNFLTPHLGIGNLRTDKRIDFVGGIRGVAELMKLVDSGDFKIAFSLYPTTINQLLTVADAGEVMPPKSTWFEPKLRDGMVVYLLEDLTV
ncbi:DUF1015 domain-containing protein [candidate division GN15 bacterium]|uniref:DUF1015 domain-containing protein n=1 Tax=candidate division GN15 bacterium TaxID=2072418 RepID=A0A855X3K2_9BACT|nr:MAG: DUF1015 domain-containing protein [candidate division GN15 bacterium]